MPAGGKSFDDAADIVLKNEATLDNIKHLLVTWHTQRVLQQSKQLVKTEMKIETWIKENCAGMLLSMLLSS